MIHKGEAIGEIVILHEIIYEGVIVNDREIIVQV